MKICAKEYCQNEIKSTEKFCFKHCCRNKECKKSNQKCDEHYCRPNIVFCGEPIKKKGDFCSKHSCPTCKKSRFECVEHFCKDNKCLNKKFNNSEYCENHTCKICNKYWPCKNHLCKMKDCQCVLLIPFNFCLEHSKNELYNHDIPIDEFNKNLFDYWNYIQNKYDENIYENYNEFKLKILKMKFINMFNNVAKKINNDIKLKDSELNNLGCTSYCSYGYCKCDLMPRIKLLEHNHDLNFIQKRNTDGWIGETVYLLSLKAILHDDNNYAAWTIPTIFIDEFEEIWDGSKENIKNLIKFEQIN